MAIQSSQLISYHFREIIQTTPSKDYSALSRDYAALSRDYGSLSKDYAKYSMLSVHNPINSTAIASELLLRRFDPLCKVETKKLVNEIMEIISTEAMPNHLVTSIFVQYSERKTSVPVLFTVATSVKLWIAKPAHEEESSFTHILKENLNKGNAGLLKGNINVIQNFRPSCFIIRTTFCQKRSRFIIWRH